MMDGPVKGVRGRGGGPDSTHGSHTQSDRHMATQVELEDKTLTPMPVWHTLQYKTADIMLASHHLGGSGGGVIFFYSFLSLFPFLSFPLPLFIYAFVVWVRAR